MGFWNYIEQLALPAARRTANREIIAKLPSHALSPRPLPGPEEWKVLADEGYRKNVIVYACVNIIARTTAQAALKVGRGTIGTPQEDLIPVESGPLVELLQRPNPEQSQFAWLERAISELQWSGNSYTHKVRSRGGVAAPSGPILELRQLAPHRTAIVPTDLGGIKEYRFPADAPGEGRPIPPEDVIHEKRYDPLSEFYGLSPIAVAARAGDLDNLAVDYLREMFMNLGEPSAFLVFQDTMPQEQHERVRSLYRDTHGASRVGGGGFHQIGTLDSSVAYQAVGSRPNEMALEGIFSHSESRICAAFGVPPILIAAWIGLLRGTYSNYEQALKDFWTDTVAPMYKRTGDRLTVDLAQEFGDELCIFFDLSRVAVLQEDTDKRRKFAIATWASGLLPRNRALELAGEAPVEGPEGDMFKGQVAGTPADGEADAAPGAVSSASNVADDSASIDAVALTAQKLYLPVQSSKPLMTADEARTLLNRAGAGLVGAAPPADAPASTGPVPPQFTDGAEDEDEASEEEDESLHLLSGSESLRLPPPQWRKAHKEADRVGVLLASAFRVAVTTAQSAISLTTLEHAIDTRDPRLAEQHVLRAWLDATTLLTEEVTDPIAELFTRGAEVGEGDLKPVTLAANTPPETLQLDPGDAAQFAASLVGELVAEVSAGAKRAIRLLIEKMLIQGLPAREVARRIKSLVGLTQRATEGVINKAAKEGLSRAEVAKLIRKLLQRRAELIAQNEAFRALSEGQEFVWRRARRLGTLRSDARQFWITAGDDAVCPICRPMDKQQRPIGEKFTTGTGELVTAPPDPHVGCFPAGTSVLPLGLLLSTSIREYEGPLVVLRTASGKQLSCTPNHPVLTKNGWLPAGRLNVGGDVVCASFRDPSMIPSGLDDQKMPARIEEVAGTFNEAGTVLSVPVPVSTPDFHGDGKGSEIAVISTHSELWNSIDATLSQEGIEPAFVEADVAMANAVTLDRGSLLDAFVLSNDPTARSAVGSSHLRSTFTCGHARPLQRFGSAPASAINSSKEQAASDPTPVSAEAARQSILGFSGKVTCDKIVDLYVVHFRGPVYNMETETHIIIAEGVVASNCRCARGLKLGGADADQQVAPEVQAGEPTEQAELVLDK